MQKSKTVFVKNPGLPSIRARAEEIESIFALFAIAQELETAEARMEKRIHAIPHGLRDLRMVRTVVSRLCTDLIGTLPAEKYDSVMANARHMAYSVRFNQCAELPTENGHNWTLVQGDDLEALISAVHDHVCFACDKHCGSCRIGKAFDRIMIQSRRRDESWEFIDMRADHAGGEVIRE